jgi:4,5-DOPA dioxygenase extradiol
MSDTESLPDEPPRGPMPAIYLGHGAPPLLDDPTWTAELAAWAEQLPRP